MYIIYIFIYILYQDREIERDFGTAFPCFGWISENLVLSVRFSRKQTTVSNCNLLLVQERRKGCSFFRNVFLNQQKCSSSCSVLFTSFLQKISVVPRKTWRVFSKQKVPARRVLLFSLLSRKHTAAWVWGEQLQSWGWRRWALGTWQSCRRGKDWWQTLVWGNKSGSHDETWVDHPDGFAVG